MYNNKQNSQQVLMVRPVDFYYNPQTAVNNTFQEQAGDHVQLFASRSFDHFVDVLKANGIGLTIVHDTHTPSTPDSIFPNNWISTHDDGTVILYPMFAENRRNERRADIISLLQANFVINKLVDLSYFELENIFLEGTGSMVLDHNNLLAYACLSERTHQIALERFCTLMHYKPVVFNAYDANDIAIYHTNVMMCIGEKFAIICLDAIKSLEERKTVSDSLYKTGKEVIAISFEQTIHFAGNMIELRNKNGEHLLVMSEQAYQSLKVTQVLAIEKYATIVYAPLEIIEQNGGGSARCMIAEIFLPQK